MIDVACFSTRVSKLLRNDFRCFSVVVYSHLELLAQLGTKNLLRDSVVRASNKMGNVFLNSCRNNVA